MHLHKNSVTQYHLISFKILLILILFFCNTKTFSQETKNQLNVFFDCSVCDMDFVKTKINYINYTIDAYDADVYIMLNQRIAGNGADEFSFIFLGRKKFSGVNDTIYYVSNPTNTNDEIRKKLILYINLGLLKYFYLNNEIENFNITFNNTQNIKKSEIDKWNKWVFKIGGNGYFASEKSYQNLMTNAVLTAEQVTEKKKIEIDFSHDNNKYTFKINDQNILSRNATNSFTNQIVWSVSNKLSIGYYLTAGNSSYYNYDFSGSFYPAIEYNFYPYSESSVRQLRINYSIGYKYNIYTDTTIYNKTEEGLFRTRLAVAHRVNKHWGIINTSVSGLLYLHDFSKNRLDISSTANIRIYKGISFSIGFGASLVHDQLYLIKGNLSVEEILLKQQQLATSYTYNFTTGLLFTFGSLYNNVVNPRF